MSDYSHRYHAGNHGDVFKHAVLVTALAEATRPGAPAVCFVETHAGEGQYTLAGTGEWTEGIGRLDALSTTETPPALGPYLAALARAGAARRTPNRGGPYPGSPRLALGLLRPADAAHLFEREPAAAGALRKGLGADARARVTQGDGWAGLAALSAATPAAQTLVAHVDPPYSEKDEWTQAADALAALRAARPASWAVLWYPIKSLTRPNALHADLRLRGVPADVVELHVTPQEVKRNALHGSGVLLLGATPALVSQACAVATALGPRLATHDGRWHVRALGWAGAQGSGALQPSAKPSTV